MKQIVLILTGIISLHGVIHLLAFVKAFDLVSIDSLNLQVSKTAGFFWMIAGLLFMAGALLYLSRNSPALFFLVPGVIISTILIVNSWGHAKYGTIGNVLVLLLIAASISSCRMQKMVNEEKQLILSRCSNSSPVVTMNDIETLPPVVQKWLKNAGVEGIAIPQSVKIQQKCRMRLKPEQSGWYEASSEQIISTREPAFLWTVDMSMSPLLKVKGRDKFLNGKGNMLNRLNNLIKIVDEEGPKIDEGTLQRYLGELVWYPVVALSSYMSWEQIDDQSARATMSYKGVEGSGIFHFSKTGDPECFTAMRFKGNTPGAPRRKWINTVNDFRVFDGIRVPTEVESSWVLKEGPWTWLRMTIEDIQYLSDNPIASGKAPG